MATDSLQHDGPEEIEVSIDPYGSTSSVKAVVEGAKIIAADGRDLSGQVLVAHWAIASIIERQLSLGVYEIKARVQPMPDGTLGATAIWQDGQWFDEDHADVDAPGDEDGE